MEKNGSIATSLQRFFLMNCTSVSSIWMENGDGSSGVTIASDARTMFSETSVMPGGQSMIR